MDEAENQISDLEYKEAKNQPIRTRRKKNSKKQDKDRLRSLWDNFRRTDIHIIGVPEGEEKDQEIENFFEKIVKEDFPNSVKKVDIKV